MIKQLKSLFNPEIDENNELFDKTKYVLSYRILLFLSVAVGILSIVYSLTNTIRFSIPTYIGFFLITLTFLYIKITKKYKVPMLLFNLFGWAICFYTLLLINNQSIISNSLWMVVSTNFAFLTSGRKGFLSPESNASADTDFFSCPCDTRCGKPPKQIAISPDSIVTASSPEGVSSR